MIIQRYVKSAIYTKVFWEVAKIKQRIYAKRDAKIMIRIETKIVTRREVRIGKRRKTKIELEIEE